MERMRESVNDLKHGESALARSHAWCFIPCGATHVAWKFSLILTFDEEKKASKKPVWIE